MPVKYNLLENQNHLLNTKIILQIFNVLSYKISLDRVLPHPEMQA